MSTACSLKLAACSLSLHQNKTQNHSKVALGRSHPRLFLTLPRIASKTNGPREAVHHSTPTQLLVQWTTNSKDQSWRGSAVRRHLLLIQASLIATDTNKLSQPYFKSTRILSQMRGEHVGGAHPRASSWGAAICHIQVSRETWYSDFIMKGGNIYEKVIQIHWF